MKSTIKVSISGIAFNLDNDAYGCLKNYLDRVENIFSGKESGREIIEDIEVRIAELLSARIQSPEQIITLATVSEVIGTVGSADDIAGGEEETASTVQEQLKTPEPERKRLFRDIDHRVIGGVCSGLGNYFTIDRVFVRLAFAMALGCFLLQDYLLHSFFNIAASASLLLYLALWIAMPAARTMKEKMIMRKEMITPASSKNDPAYTKAAHEGDFGRVLGKILVITCRIIIGFVLAIIAFVALTLLITLPFGLFTGNVMMGELGWLNITDYLQDYTLIPSWLVVILLTLLVCLPLVGLIYLLAKIFFKFKTKIRLGLILTVVWLITLFSLAGIGIYLVSGNTDFTRELFLENSFPGTSEQRAAPPFQNLSIAGNFEVTALPSDSNYIVIQAPEKLLPHIQTKATGGSLKIYVNKAIRQRRAKARLYLYCADWKSMEQLHLSGMVRFTCTDTLKAQAFSAKLSGASHLDVVVHNEYTAFDMSGASNISANIVAERVHFNLSGACKATLSGAASRTDLKVSGAARINAARFAVDTAKVRLSGSSNIGLHVNNYLDIHASGASRIHYTGTPATDLSVSGAAKVQRAKDVKGEE
ncbi:MAG: DUF2807 domain-containing protein [Prevotellaceae bacterium]|jgi:phage shock protein PspC (stress-responsive transcriptional regulator)|nr:DUF2807 domain-containing protein [Prevotellaceae bacterium]